MGLAEELKAAAAEDEGSETGNDTLAANNGVLPAAFSNWEIFLQILVFATVDDLCIISASSKFFLSVASSNILWAPSLSELLLGDDDESEVRLGHPRGDSPGES